MEELEIAGTQSPEQEPQMESAAAEPEPESESAPEPEQATESAEEKEPSHLVVMDSVPADELLATEESADGESAAAEEDGKLKAVIEALVYVAEDPITVAQVAASLEQPVERVRLLMAELIAEFDQPGRGIQIREVAGGYRMATKPEHHDAVRAFVKSLKAPLKLSLPALETLAVIAYKQPVTAPEVKEIRGVQGTGVLSTLLDRKLIAEAGRKNVIGKPILYKTTKEFLIQFGLKDLSELPTLKEFEEIRRMAMPESELAEQAQGEAAVEPAPEAGAEAAESAQAVDVAEPGPADAVEGVAAENGAAGPAAEAAVAQPAADAAAAEPAPAEPTPDAEPAPVPEA